MVKKKNLISSSFKESFALIRKNKSIFLVLFLLQLLFFSLIFILNLNYQPKILESVNNVISYVGSQNPAEGKNVLGDDPLMIHRNYKNMLYNLILLGVWSFLACILINGPVWYLTSRLVYDSNLKNLITNYKKTLKEFFIYLSKFAFSSLVFFALLFLTFSAFKASLFSFLSETTSFNFASLLITFILIYFVYLALALIYKTKLKNMHKELFNVGVKKWNIILMAYFINLIVLFVLFLFIIFLAEQNLVLLSLSVLLLMAGFVWARVFLVMVVKKLV